MDYAKELIKTVEEGNQVIFDLKSRIESLEVADAKGQVATS